MWTRRRFMVLLGGATTGPWLASTGIVPLDRSYVLAAAGLCSFCGAPRPSVRAMVGVPGRRVRICDQCIGLSCEILAETVEGWRAPSGGPSRVVPTLEDERFDDDLANVLRELADQTVPSRRLLDELRRAIEPSPSFSFTEFCCSFCDAHRRDVATLISGPRVFICDGCTGGAAAVVAHVLRA
ncbi:MAG: ClpX C4-type zinc finger protein [Kofleriaceae bacterium]